MDLSQYWESIIDTMKEGLLVINPEGTIIAVNPAAEALTGYSAQELIGSSCRVLDCTGCVIYGDGPAKSGANCFRREWSKPRSA